MGQFGQIGIQCPKCSTWRRVNDHLVAEACKLCGDQEYSEVKDLKNELVPWGLLTSIDLYDCNPIALRDPLKIREYAGYVCDELLHVKRYGACQVVHFGEDERVRGLSMVQLIETSLISGHFAEKSNSAYLDVFSCKMYEPDVLAKHAKEFFGGRYMKYHITWRM